MSATMQWFATCALIVLPASAAAATLSGAISVVAADGRAAKKPNHSGAVVWLETVGTAARPPASAPRPATMEQRNRTFIPHILAVEVGTAVDFPNADPFFHNAFSNYSGQIFDVHLYAPQTSRRVVFRRPGIVHLFCNIHEEMSAVIAVLATPYFAVTGADGRFSIQAPPGEYRLHVWHERADPDALPKLSRTVTVTAQDVAMPELRVTLSGAPAPPHKNKYGQAYASRPAEHVFYPGARR